MPSCIVVSDEPTRRVSHQRQHHTHRLSTAFPAAPALLAPPSPSPSVSAIDVEECIGGGPLDYGAGIMGGGGIPGDIGDLPPPPPPPPPDSIPTGDYCAIFRVYYHDKPPCLRCRKFLVSDYAKFVLIHPIPSTRDTELCDSIIPTDYLTQLKDTVTQNSTAIRHLKQGQPASVAARLPEPPIVTHPIGYCSVFETEYSLESPPCLAQKFPTEKYPGFTQVNLHQKVTREEVESLKKHLQFAISQNSVILQALAEEERKLDDQLAEYNLCPVPVDSATTKL
ncbi:hypothetical protein Pelo_7022 [Pelomyxa schiedti]|nr:hypothetical protein Pelo_7022 [Pelomyxa schiedti]